MIKKLILALFIAASMHASEHITYERSLQHKIINALPPEIGQGSVSMSPSLIAQGFVGTAQKPAQWLVQMLGWRKIQGITHGSSVSAVAVSADGTVIVTGSTDNRARILVRQADD